MNKIKLPRIVYIGFVSVFVISSFLFYPDTRGLLVEGEYNPYVSELLSSKSVDNNIVGLGVILFLPVLIISCKRIGKPMSLFEYVFNNVMILFQFGAVFLIEAGSVVNRLKYGNNIMLWIWALSFCGMIILTQFFFFYGKEKLAITIDKMQFLRIAYNVFVLLFVISSFLFDNTKGLLEKGEKKNYVIDSISSSADDNIVIVCGAIIFFPILIMSFIRIYKMMNLAEFIIGNIMNLFQMLFMLCGIDAGSIIETMIYDKNIILWIWVLSFCTVIILTQIFFISSKTKDFDYVPLQ